MRERLKKNVSEVRESRRRRRTSFIHAPSHGINSRRENAHALSVGPTGGDISAVGFNTCSLRRRNGPAALLRVIIESRRKGYPLADFL
ncbi:hypothetical protein MTR_3g011160 [Medicago truncatula]|uniref:Uncharacterized protein n=1 Tax=Medicago truncatula TaxID=3880 RepID=G7IVR6_MEDTR|nr:hypothetical protein MTR_3g011160 [Medicago truncatula]